MAGWYLRILGKPQLVRGDEVIVPWRSGQYWGLLTHLVLQRGPVSRAALAAAFWPDVDDPRSHLRVALQRLRGGLPQELEILDSGEGAVTLQPVIGCDLVELRQWIKKAGREQNIVHRRHCLEEASHLIRGPFLEGCAAEQLEYERQKVLVQCKSVLQQLVVLQKAAGFLQDGIATQRLLVSLDGEDPSTKRSLLNEFDASMLEECLTVPRLVNSVLSQVGKEIEPVLLRLSVFPGRFSGDAAMVIAGATSEILNRLVQMGTLQVHDDLFIISETLRKALWKRLTSEQRRRLRLKHARFYIDDALALNEEIAKHIQGADGWADVNNASTRWLNYLADIGDDCECVLMTAKDFGEMQLVERYFLVVWASGDSLRSRMVHYISIVEKMLRDELSIKLRLEVTSVIISANIFVYDLYKYILEFVNWIENVLIENLTHEDLDLCAQVLSQVLIVTHHRGEDSLFDRGASCLMNLHQRYGTHFEWHIAGENYRSRHRFEEALVCNNELTKFWKDRDHPGMMGVALLQRGMIAKGFGDTEQARQSWNEALQLLERSGNIHEKASCLVALSELYREQGWLSEAKHLAESAVDLFQTAGDLAAVHAANGVLGDILCDQGNLCEARSLFAAAAAFWHEKGHPRWTAIFQNRLLKWREISENRQRSSIHAY